MKRFILAAALAATAVGLKVIAQTDAAYEACERKEAGQRVRIDVEAGRQLGIRGLAP